jgi:MFS family permease
MGAFGLNLSAGQFFAPLSSVYGWNISTLSLAVAMNMITWGLFQPAAGRLIDWFGPKPVIASSTAIMGIAFLLSATITEVWQFFLYYGVLTAIGFAGCGSMANSVLVVRWYVRGRARMLARSSMGINMGQLLLLPLAGWLVATAGYQMAFVVLGSLMLVVVTPVVLVFVRNDPRAIGQAPDGDPRAEFRPPPSAALSEALQSRDFWAATLGFVTCGYSLYLVAIHLPRYAIDLGGGLALGGQLLGIAAAASAGSMWLTGQLAPRRGKKELLLWLYLLRTACLIFLALSTSLWQLYVFAVLYGAASFPIIPLKTGLIGDRFGANAMGSILGSAWLLHQVFAALGVFAGGYLRTLTGSYHAAFWSAAALLALGALSTNFFRETGRSAGPALTHA